MKNNEPSTGPEPPDIIGQRRLYKILILGGGGILLLLIIFWLWFLKSAPPPRLASAWTKAAHTAFYAYAGCYLIGVGAYLAYLLRLLRRVQNQVHRRRTSRQDNQ